MPFFVTVIFDQFSGHASGITQICAIGGEEKFSTYVLPSVPITEEAKAITGMEVIGGILHNKGQAVTTVSTFEALVEFKNFLSSFPQPPILLGHNIKTFDVPILNHHLLKHNMYSEFKRHITAFVDTKHVAKVALPNEASYKLEELVTKHLAKTYDAHNAVADVEALIELSENHLNISVSPFVFHLDTVNLTQSLLPLVKADAMSPGMRKKCVASGLRFSHLLLAHKRDKSGGIKHLLCKPGPDSKARVTKNSKVIDKINRYFEQLCM